MSRGLVVIVGVVLLAVYLGVTLGMAFPDSDQAAQAPFVVHRSILTHGLLLPLLLFGVTLRFPHPALRLGTIGFASATVIHLSFDLFPNAWRGYALIHIPLMGWASPLFSQFWMLASMLGCMVIIWTLVRHGAEVVIAAVLLVSVFVYLAPAEGWRVPHALLALLGVIGVSLLLPSRPRESLVQAYRRWHENVGVGM